MLKNINLHLQLVICAMIFGIVFFAYNYNESFAETCVGGNWVKCNIELQKKSGGILEIFGKGVNSTGVSPVRTTSTVRPVSNSTETYYNTGRFNSAGEAVYLPKPSCADGCITRGSTGANVRFIQEQLNAAGYKVKVDGIYGPESIAAFKKWQAERGIQADGIPGAQSVAEMRNDERMRASEGDSIVASFKSDNPTGVFTGINESAEFQKYKDSYLNSYQAAQERYNTFAADGGSNFKDDFYKSEIERLKYDSSLSSGERQGIRTFLNDVDSRKEEIDKAFNLPDLSKVYNVPDAMPLGMDNILGKTSPNPVAPRVDSSRIGTLQGDIDSLKVQKTEVQKNSCPFEWWECTEAKKIQTQIDQKEEELKSLTTPADQTKPPEKQITLDDYAYKVYEPEATPPKTEVAQGPKDCSGIGGVFTWGCVFGRNESKSETKPDYIANSGMNQEQKDRLALGLAKNDATKEQGDYMREQARLCNSNSSCIDQVINNANNGKFEAPDFAPKTQTRSLGEQLPQAPDTPMREPLTPGQQKIEDLANQIKSNKDRMENGCQYSLTVSKEVCRRELQEDNDKLSEELRKAEKEETTRIKEQKELEQKKLDESQTVDVRQLTKPYIETAALDADCSAMDSNKPTKFNPSSTKVLCYYNEEPTGIKFYSNSNKEGITSKSFESKGEMLMKIIDADGKPKLIKVLRVEQKPVVYRHNPLDNSVPDFGKQNPMDPKSVPSYNTNKYAYPCLLTTPQLQPSKFKTSDKSNLTTTQTKVACVEKKVCDDAKLHIATAEAQVKAAGKIYYVYEDQNNSIAPNIGEKATSCGPKAK